MTNDPKETSVEDGAPDLPPGSRGLGDTIAKITKKAGIRQCGGCRKRQAQLNRLVPYKNKDKVKE